MADDLDDKFARMARELAGGMPALTDLDLLINESNLLRGESDEITETARKMRGTTAAADIVPASEQLESERQDGIREHLREQLDRGIRPVDPEPGS